jgi:hypothetical protein
VSEHINADAKEKHGMHRAQFRGRRKMQIQALLTAATMNLKRLMARRPVAQSGMVAWKPLARAICAFRTVRWAQSLHLSRRGSSFASLRRVKGSRCSWIRRRRLH